MNPPLVLLPGMMCDARLFAPQLSAFVDRAISVAELTGSDTVATLAARVLDSAPERFALAGLSMGGIVAMEVIAQAPERVAGVALMDTNPLAETDRIKARRGPQIERVRAGQLADVMRDEMKPNYLTDGPDRAQILDLCMDMALGLGPEVFIRQSVALRDRPDQCETLRAFSRPALVLCGADDSLCPLSRHELMRDLLPRGRLTVIDRAGHLPTLEQPGKTTAALRCWLEEVDNE